jgi:hypothetical protein
MEGLSERAALLLCGNAIYISVRRVGKGGRGDLVFTTALTRRAHGHTLGARGRGHGGSALQQERPRLGRLCPPYVKLLEPELTWPPPSFS